MSFTLKIVFVLLLKKNFSSSIVSRILPATPPRRFLQLLPLGSLFPCLNSSFPMTRPWFGSGAFVFEFFTFVPILFAFVAGFLRPEHLSAVVSVRLVSSFGCVLLSSCCVYILFSQSFGYFFRKVSFSPLLWMPSGPTLCCCFPTVEIIG